MGLDVVLVEHVQRGTSTKRRSATIKKVVGDPDSTFANVLERVTHLGRTPLLDRIDLFGTRELGHNDMPQFICELEGVDHSWLGDSERLALNRVLSLAAECLSGPSFVLRLEGD
jgi:hypothetical protein